MTPYLKSTNGEGGSTSSNGAAAEGSHHQCHAKQEDEIYKKIVIVTTVGYVCSLLTIFFLVNDEVPQPYMDEIFHVEQARAYCVGNFTQWNSKITTPPGLYLTTLGFLKPFSELYAFGEEHAAKICPTFMLRFVNLLFAIANAYVIYLIGLQTVKNSTQQRSGRINLLLSTFSMATFPPLFFFTFLYYTDSGSLFFVLLMYLYHVNNQEWLASLFGAISLLYRQTNIVWMFFLASHTSLKITAKYVEKSKKRAKLVHIARGVIPQILQTCGGYAIVGCLFLVFIIFNKGIVVGDRSAHEAAFNVPQLFYFLGFLSLFSFTFVYTISNMREFAAFAVTHRFSLLLIATLMGFALMKLTYVHPYLLADNRHYTFYAWRRIFGRGDGSVVPYLCIPIYMYTAFSAQNMVTTQDTVWKCLFSLCLAVTVIPQQLLEFRYFLIPYFFWRLNLTTNSTYQLVIEFLVNTIINCFTLYMFLYKTFRWDHSQDVQRFMW